MSEVWKYSKARGTDRLVLLALADQARDETREAWPSISYLAKRCLCDKRTVQRNIRNLEGIGEVLVIRGAAGIDRHRPKAATSNTYRIVVYLLDDEGGDLPGGGLPGGDTSAGEGVAQVSPLGVAQVSPKPLPITVSDPSKETCEFEAEFAQVWQAYPKRVDRGRALRAYGDRRREGADAGGLLAATQHYASAMRGTEPRFVKYASTFFGPDRPYADFVAGVPAGMGASAKSESMASVDRVLAAVGGGTMELGQ